MRAVGEGMWNVLFEGVVKHKRNRRKNTSFNGPGTGMSNWPITTPTSSTDVTVPSENDLYLS